MRIQLHAEGAHLRVDELRLQLLGGRLSVAILLVISNTAEEAKGTPEYDHVADHFRIRVECESMPIGRVFGAPGHIRKAGYPDHLFHDTGKDAERHSPGDRVEQGRLLKARSKPPPERPAKNAPQEILHAPPFDEDA